MEEKILGYISQYSEWAVGGSIETTSTNVKFYELNGLYYKLETSINILGEKDSSEYEVKYTEIIEEFKEAMQHENSFTNVNCKTVDALADCIMDYEIENKQLQKDVEAAVKINV